jgi:hypothetical protein
MSVEDFQKDEFDLTSKDFPFKFFDLDIRCLGFILSAPN